MTPSGDYLPLSFPTDRGFWSILRIPMSLQFGDREASALAKFPTPYGLAFGVAYLGTLHKRSLAVSQGAVHGTLLNHGSKGGPGQTQSATHER